MVPLLKRLMFFWTTLLHLKILNKLQLMVSHMLSTQRLKSLNWLRIWQPLSMLSSCWDLSWTFWSKLLKSQRRLELTRISCADWIKLWLQHQLLPKSNTIRKFSESTQTQQPWTCWLVSLRVVGRFKVLLMISIWCNKTKDTILMTSVVWEVEGNSKEWVAGKEEVCLASD